MGQWWQWNSGASSAAKVSYGPLTTAQVRARAPNSNEPYVFGLSHNPQNPSFGDMDNAMMESFFSTLKSECATKPYASRA